MSALPISFELPRGVSRVDEATERARALPSSQILSLGWPSLDALLPDGGLPRGVVEVASRGALGGPTRLAARAIAAAQARAPEAWCAWLDPEATLHAPGLARSGIDLARLFVVRPQRAELGRIAVKVARSGAFDLIVVDMDALGEVEAWPPPYPGTSSMSGPSSRGSRAATSTSRSRRALPSEIVVRKLALAAEESGTTLLLLTDATKARTMPWPVALRLELERRPDAMSVRVAKDRRGRASVVKTWIPVAELSDRRERKEPVRSPVRLLVGER